MPLLQAIATSSRRSRTTARAPPAAHPPIRMQQTHHLSTRRAQQQRQPYPWQASPRTPRQTSTTPILQLSLLLRFFASRPNDDIVSNIDPSLPMHVASTCLCCGQSKLGIGR